jgi:hypothetical protein
MVSPFSIGISNMLAISCANSSGLPRRGEVTDVRLPYVSFRYTYRFLADGAEVTSAVRLVWAALPRNTNLRRSCRRVA